MLELRGFQFLDKVYETQRTLIYSGKRLEDNLPVTIKILALSKPTAQEIKQFEYEYKIGSQLNLSGVPKYLSLENYGSSRAIVFEQFNGVSLNHRISEGPVGLKEFLVTAIQLSKILGEIHKNQIIHKDIKPHNIIYNRDQHQVKIIDFSISSRVKREVANAVNPDHLEGTLSYISPEQTGRMNRSVDFRTDYYSLGVTFYQMLTGVLPFTGSDVLEIVHAHMAVSPKPLDQVNPEIPAVISAMVLKLMAKTAEDRYQSMEGLTADLTNCLEQLVKNGKIEDFPVGQNDQSGIFQIPEKLYGRDEETSLLFREFEKVSNGKTGVVFFEGLSGSGKSFLINEIQKPLVKQKGYFIWGKFDQFKKNIPYSSVIQAFQELINQVLTENEEKARKWKEAILRAVGENGQIVVDIIPELELIIGKQAPLPFLEAAEAQNRFNFTFQNFIKVFTNREHPLVMFLDDLQWADGASLKWLSMTLKDSEMGYFLFIGSFRSNEVDKAHPLSNLFDDLKKNGLKWQNIEMKPLSDTSITEMVKDTVHAEPAVCAELAKLIHQKTGGNPFFITEFLKSLYNDGFIVFDGGWKIDFAQIKNARVTDNVVQFMADKLKKLPESTRDIMKIASCMGVRFYFDTLSRICNVSEDEIFLELKEAINEGMIILQDKTARFAHDRIQESAYSLIPETERVKNHYNIGKIMLADTSDDRLDDRIFAIVHQLNNGKELVSDAGEKIRLAKLNQKAGQKAKASTAYEEAKQYFNNSLGLLPQKPWNDEYALTLSLNTDLGETSYLIGDYNQAEKYFDAIIKNGKTALDKVRVYELRIILYTAELRYDDGLRTSKEAFRLLKIKMPRKATMLKTLMGLISVNMNMIGKKIDDLFGRKEISNEYHLAQVRIMTNFLPLAYLGFPPFYPIAVCKLVNMTLNYGNSIYASFGYVVYGLIVCNVLGNVKLGNQFGDLGMKLLDKYQDKTQKPKTYLMNEGMTAHWQNHLSKVQPYIQDVIDIGLEIGDLQYTSYGVNVLVSNRLFLGENLELVKEAGAKYLPVMYKLKQQDTLLSFLSIYQCILNMGVKGEEKIRGEYFDEDRMLPEWEKTNKGLPLFAFLIHSSINFYLNGFYKKCVEIGDRYGKHEDKVLGLQYIPQFYFYNVLAMIAYLREGKPAGKKRIRKNIGARMKKFAKWAVDSHENLSQKYCLMEAEYMDLAGAGDFEATLKKYDQAISLARQHQYVNDEAIANERAARYCFRKNLKNLGVRYISNAYQCYNIWGVTSKAALLLNEFRDLIVTESVRPSVSEGLSSFSTTIASATTMSRAGTSTSTTDQILDLSTVMKSSQVIAGEIVMEKLLGKLTKILMENMGAQKTVLVFEREGKWCVETVARIGENGVNIEMKKCMPVTGSEDVPEAMVVYVARKKEHLVLNNAGREGEFTKNPYVMKNGVKSVLCSPIINHGKVMGIIYLENNQVAGVFTQDRLQMLNMLTGQIGISLDNAELYEKLEEYSKNLEIKVDERTRELNVANQELTKKQAQIKQELDVARIVQMALIPAGEKLPSLNRIQLAAFYIPMEDIGGDIYDVIRVDDDRYAFLIADVSGHGVPAALITMLMKASFNYHSEPGVPVRSIMKEINEEMVDLIGDMDHYFTAYYGILKLSSGEFSYTNGGHHPAIWYRAREKKLEKLDSSGAIMGSFGGINFEDGKVVLEKGDGVLFYTDGIDEARGEKGGFYTEERLMQFLLDYGHLSAVDFVKKLSDDLRQFIGKRTPTDDQTLLYVKLV